MLLAASLLAATIAGPAFGAGYGERDWRPEAQSRDVQRRGIIKLFSQPTYGGRSLDLQENTPDFSTRHYNDRASSIIVSEGVWELCTNAGYGGQCRLYGPGRYPDLGYGLDGRISSARVVRGRPENWDRPRVGAFDSSRLIMFRGRGLHGPSLAVSGAVRDMGEVRFNDAANSLLVEGSPWLVCSDAGFRGNCRVLNPGRYDDLGAAGLRHSISSARPERPEHYGAR
jgi:hypothetical protein